MARFSYKYPDPLTGGAPPNIPQNVYVIGVALVVGLMTGAGAEALKYLVKAISEIVTAYNRKNEKCIFQKRKVHF